MMTCNTTEHELDSVGSVHTIVYCNCSLKVVMVAMIAMSVVMMAIVEVVGLLSLKHLLTK